MLAIFHLALAQPHLFPHRTAAGFPFSINVEFTGRDHLLYTYQGVPMMFTMLFFLLLELLVSGTKLIIRNVRIYFRGF